MKIVIGFEYPFSARGYGGGNQIVRGLARAFTRLGHDVHVACGGTDELGVTQEDVGVTYHFTTPYRARTAAFDTTTLALRVAEKIGAGMVISTTSEAGPLTPLARARGIFTVVYVATPRLPVFRRLSRTFLHDVRYQWGPFLQFLGALAADRMVTVSHSLRVEAIENWGIGADRVERVGLGMDEVLLDVPVTSPPAVGVGGPNLLSVGRLVHWQKPFDVMARGLASVNRQWSAWTIVGAGVDERELRSLVADLGISDRVRFRGTLLREAVRQEIDRSHIVLLPSRYEGYASTVYEAASRARVIVTNDVNDVVRSFGDAGSVLVAAEVSPESYREVIERAIDDYGSLARAAESKAAGIRLTETWDMVARRVMEVSRDGPGRRIPATDFAA